MANITAILLFIRSRDKQLSKNPPFAFMYVHVLEQFLIECCKTKTKVWVITPANHKKLRQYSEPIRAQSNYMKLTQGVGK